MTSNGTGHEWRHHILEDIISIDISKRILTSEKSYNSDKNKYVKTDFNNSTDNNYNTQSQKDDHPEGSEVKKVVLKTLNMMILPNTFNADKKSIYEEVQKSFRPDQKANKE